MEELKSKKVMGAVNLRAQKRKVEKNPTVQKNHPRKHPHTTTLKTTKKN